VIQGQAERRGSKLSTTEIDAVLERHFLQEAAGDVAGTLATVTYHVEHDFVGEPMGILHGRDAVGERYGHLFANVRGERVEGLHRLYGDDFVVDDKIWTARVPGDFLGIAGHDREISVRVLHVFEFRDGLIARENVWLDGGSAIAQLMAPPGTMNSAAG
jgi:hypothetical protein